MNLWLLYFILTIAFSFSTFITGDQTFLKQQLPYTRIVNSTTTQHLEPIRGIHSFSLYLSLNNVHMGICLMCFCVQVPSWYQDAWQYREMDRLQVLRPEPLSSLPRNTDPAIIIVGVVFEMPKECNMTISLSAVEKDTVEVAAALEHR